MALSDKNITITPNIGQAADPKIVFSGADASTAAQDITLSVYPISNGALSFEGTAGQLFSINNDLSGTLFSVNDGVGVPLIEVEDTGTVSMVSYGGSVGIGTSLPAEQLHITGNFRIGDAVQSTPTGSAPLYACRAWVNFQGNGTVTIRSSGNVSSVTDLGVGSYQVNFTTAMPDTNYAVTCSSWQSFSVTGVGQNISSFNTTHFRIDAYENNASTDHNSVYVAVFR